MTKPPMLTTAALATLIVALSHFSSDAFANKPGRYNGPYQDQDGNISRDDYTGTWWLNVGGGFGTTTSYTAPTADTEQYDEDQPTAFNAMTASFNYAIQNNQFVTLRSAWAGSFVDSTCPGSCGKILDNIWDLGVLYGLMLKNDNMLVSGAAGVAYTAFEYKPAKELVYSNGNYVQEDIGGHSTSSRVGVPLEFQLFFTPSDFFGIGLIGLGNLNTEAPFAAGLIGVQFGNLK